MVSGTISLFCSKCFSPSFTVLVHYRSLGSSPTGWSRQIHENSSCSALLRTTTRLRLASRTRAIMLYGCTFQNILLTNFLATAWSCNPTHAVTWMVSAVPVRSPLLGESLFIFFSCRYLRFFSFPCVSLPHCGVYPFKDTWLSHRKSADQRSFAPTRSLSQLITFLSCASESQGIRHVPLLTFCLTDHVSSIYLSAFNFTFFGRIISKIVSMIKD